VIQKVSRGGVDVRVGRELPGPLALETWVSFEKASVDSTAEVYRDRELLDRESGDDIPFEVLPPSIQDDIDDRPQTRFGAALALDTRRGTGLVTRGLWGKGSVEAVVSSEEDFARLVGDFRTYAPVGRHALLATRLRAGAVTSGAPFYERFYVGGLYTVRGYPSHALSPPQGDLNLATASVELRTAWVGPPSDPRVVGLLFADGGISWGSGDPDHDDGGAGIGYGFRVRIPWAGHLGVDVGTPLSSSPVDEAFHVNLSLGWTF
jgi:outer membrane protein insertion porin family